MSNRAMILTGWLLFLLSSIGFLIASIRAGDGWAIMGSLAFMVACLFFLVPFFRDR